MVYESWPIAVIEREEANPMTKHKPVMKREVIEFLDLHPGNVVIDATLGGGGHSQAIADKIKPAGILIGLDLDHAALQRTEQLLYDRDITIRLFHTNFKEMGSIVKQLNISKVDAILFDLGVSSDLLEDAERGFSFSDDGPLDMRMNRNFGQTAATLINTLSQEQLENIFFLYGQEQHSRHYARMIYRARQKEVFQTTSQLRDLIHRHTPRKWRDKLRIDPATRIFQALRIAVNDELTNLKDALPIAVDLLQTNGRMALISFHSLEDGIVKRFFLEEARDCICPPDLPICRCKHKARLRILTRRPVTPSPEELSDNPRSRSAKLRVAERISTLNEAERYYGG